MSMVSVNWEDGEWNLFEGVRLICYHSFPSLVFTTNGGRPHTHSNSDWNKGELLNQDKTLIIIDRVSFTDLDQGSEVNICVYIDYFWTKHHALRQLGQLQKLSQAWSWTTVGKFSLSKSVKHTVRSWQHGTQLTLFEA